MALIQNDAMQFIWVMSVTLVSIILWFSIKRTKTRLQLSSGKCRLPTVCWMPRFVNYHPGKDEHGYNDAEQSCYMNVDNLIKKKMPSSNITNILPRMERLNGPYGMYATVYGVSTKVVHVAHPIPARAILMGNSSIPQSKSKVKARTSIAESLGAVKKPAYDHFKNFSGDGVFTADGNIWKAKRASLLHCLLKGVSKANSEESLRLEREANRAADSFISDATISTSTDDGDGDGDGTVNIVPILQRATINLIFRFITHYDMDKCFDRDRRSTCSSSRYTTSRKTTRTQQYCDQDQDQDQTDDNQSFDDSSSSSSSSCSSPPTTTPTEYPLGLDIGKDVRNDKYTRGDDNDSPWLSSYLEAITNIRMVILAQSRSIWFLLPRWFYRTFSSMFVEEEKQMAVIRKVAQAACDNAQIGSPLQMLRSKESHNPSMDSHVKNGEKVNKELIDEAITLLFAGQDTSAATLSWTLHLLSLYPNVQNRLAKEVRESMESAGAGKSETNFVTKKMITKMPYLDAVIKEAMRLYPVAPFVVRRLPDDLSIPSPDSNDGIITIPKDTFACIWIYGLHRNGKLWHKPDDFVPERWLDSNLQKLDEAQTKYKGSFMPFAAGPRNCVGQPLAQSILRIILARIINECEVIDLRMKAFNENTSGNDSRDKAVGFRKDMQAGFTVLPSGGVKLSVTRAPKKIC